MAWARATGDIVGEEGAAGRGAEAANWGIPDFAKCVGEADKVAGASPDCSARTLDAEAVSRGDVPAAFEARCRWLPAASPASTQAKTSLKGDFITLRL